MQEYDFRITDEVVDKASITIDQLSNKNLVELSEKAEELQQRQDEERLSKAKEYFQAAILPGLKDFAEMSSSILYIEEHDEKLTMQAIFKNELGFDITESCRLMRSLLFMSNFIGIMTEGKETILSLVYEYKELIDY